VSRLAMRRCPWSVPSGWAWCVCRPGRGGGGTGGGDSFPPVGLPSPASGTHRQAKGVGVVRVIFVCPLRRRCELSPRQKGAAGVCRHPRDISRGKQRSPIGFKRRKRAPSRDPKPAQASGHGPWGGPRRSSRGQAQLFRGHGWMGSLTGAVHLRKRSEGVQRWTQ